MKKIMIVTLALLLTSSAFATEIFKGRYDQKTGEIVLTIGHGGGCDTHEFELDYSKFCLETFPAQQSAKLVHHTEDKCEAYLTGEYRIKVQEKMICTPTYLRITSSDRSEVTVFIQ